MMRTIVLAAAFAAGGPARAAPIQLPPLKEKLLDNGLLTVVAERHELPMVSVRLLLRAGSARDPAGKEGLGQLVATVLRRGTANRTADQIDEAVESIGGRLSVDVSSDATYIALSAPSERLADLLEVAADLAIRPSFPQKEVDDARERTLAGLARDLDEPSVVADRATTIAAWGDHPYGHPAEGWTRTVRTLKRDDAVAFHKAVYVPRGSVLIVVGDADVAAVQEICVKFFGAWKAPAREVPALPEPAAPRPGVTLIDKPDATQSQVRLVYPGVVRAHPDYFPLVVGTTSLGGGFTSRLMDEVRVNRGLTYGISARAGADLVAGRVRVGTFTKTETTREIIDVTRKVIADFQASGPSPKELAKTQRYLNGLYPLGLETDDDLARVLADVHLYGLGYDYVTAYPDRIAAVDKKGVVRAAQAWLAGQAPAIVVVGKAAEVKKQLEGLGEIRELPLSAVE